MVRSANGVPQPKSAITVLQERLEQLQDAARTRGFAVDEIRGHVESQAPSAASVTANSAGLAGQAPAQSVACSERPAKRRREGAARPDTHHGLDLLALGAMAEPTRRTGEMLRELSIPHLIFAATEVFGGNPERSQRIDRLWDCVARDIKRPRLDADRASVPTAEGFDCLRKYFELVDFRYPGLWREDVERGMSIICRDPSAADGGTLANPVDTFAALMVIAIVPLVVDDYSSAYGSFVSIHMLSRALQRLEDIFQLDDGIEIIQSLCLLVVYSLQNPAAGSSWHLIGFAMKKCIALGLHREPEPPDSRLEEQRQEKHRWVFWSCYLLDRSVWSERLESLKTEAIQQANLYCPRTPVQH